MIDLRSTILKEHSKKQCDKVVAYVGNNPARFSELVNLFLSEPYRVTQRAAWPLSNCIEKNPKLIQPHLKKLLDFVIKPNVHDAVKRNVVRLLQFIDIPKQMQGQTVKICFQFFNNKKEPVCSESFFDDSTCQSCKEIART
jgi:hypothetical protein